MMDTQLIIAMGVNLGGCMVVATMLIATLTRAKLSNREYVDLADVNATDSDKMIAALIHIRRLYDERTK